VNDLPAYQQQCLACTAADFLKYGQKPINIGTYSGTTVPIACQCLVCGTIAAKRLGNLRSFGPQCEGCYAPIRGDRCRFSQEQAAQILHQAGWTMTGHYEAALKSVEAVCQGCGKVDGRRVGEIHAKLKWVNLEVRRGLSCGLR
jgi:hypothetical protein